MATYTTLKNGSSGSDVKKLQQALVDAGYSVGSAGVDGIYGSATAAAVKAYQKANGLSVDGIAGNQTLGSLYGSSTATTPTTTEPTKSAASNTFEYKGYTPSDSVEQAKAALNAQLASKPGAYQSAWQAQLNDTLNKIMNRDKFSYDLNGDALYQQYKDQYTTQGKQAMMDTMGQAAAMTGGYGNSYAQSVGQQTYQGYLQQLNDKVPELYQLALDKYNREGEDLYNQYGLMADRENLDYSRYRDTVSDFQNERAYLSDQYNTERELDRSIYDSDRNFNYGTWSDQKSYDYQAERDNIEDEWKQKEFDEAVRQFNVSQKKSSVSSGGSSGGGGGSSGSTGGSEGAGGNGGTGGTNPGVSPTPSKNTTTFIATAMTKDEYMRRGNSYNQYLDYIKSKLESASLTAGEFAYLEDYYKL